ncbi:glycosyl transferase family 1 [Chloroflexus islandicus]|uniref:Glycosyl transferase family 1 n=1 Tax=Chloroflexus islandicus TaxID=1707952 RepID=A0A178MKD0_9CHLR|nr:glycosyltransferase family 4 protein [Chloroflexus islandicus]OAN48568.1 glycosyl transferase family 1 [Chloroflexus islandicus]
MRVLLAVHHFPPKYSAGAELYTMRLAHELLRRGHEAEVVCVETLAATQPFGVQAELDRYEGITVWRLHLGLRDAPANWSYANPAIEAWLRERMRVWQPEVMHLHSGYLIGAGAITAAHALGIPTVVTLHDYWFLCPRITLLRGDGSLCRQPPDDPAECAWCLQLDRRRYRLPEQISGGWAGRAWIRLAGNDGRDEQQARRETLRAALAQADLIISPSHFLAGLFGAQLPQIQVIRLGIARERLRNILPIRSGSILRLGYIGQIAPHKGVHVLITALKSLPHSDVTAELAIFGNTEQHPAYTRYLRRLIGDNPHIHLAGKFSHDQLPTVLSRVDAVVVPSIWYENSPLSIMEAHAAGRPVITSRLGGMAELVRDGVDGLHFTPNDSRDLARQLQRLRTEKGLLERLRDGIKPPPSIDDEMQTLLSHYTALIERRGAVRGRV